MSDAKKSDPKFTEVRSPYEYEYYTFPKEILYNNDLSGNALKLLLTILDYGKRPNWILRQTHLMRATGFKRCVYDTAIECLEDCGYVKRTREAKAGKYTPYEYKYCAFPVLKEKVKEKIPVQVFRSGTSAVENQHYTSSSNTNVLEETTNPPKEKAPKKVVSSSFEKLKEIEEIVEMSESQRRTLYKKFTHEEILKALKAVDLSIAGSAFAVIYSAIVKNYEPGKKNPIKDPEPPKLYNQMVEYIEELKLPVKFSFYKGEIQVLPERIQSKSFCIKESGFEKDFKDFMSAVIQFYQQNL